MSDSTPSYFKSVPDNLPVRRAKTAIVTGASSGIGLELAKKLSLNGYRERANSRNITSANTLDGTGDLKLVDGDIAMRETAKRVEYTPLQIFGRVALMENQSPLFLQQPSKEKPALDVPPACG